MNPKLARLNAVKLAREINPEARVLSYAMACPKMWLVDTGSGYDLVSVKLLSKAQLKRAVKLDTPLELYTAMLLIQFLCASML